MTPITKCWCGGEMRVDLENEIAVCEDCNSSVGGASVWRD